jgi:hypothetical protein
VTKSGYLYAFANDAWGFYGNNRGSVQLTVTRMSGEAQRTVPARAGRRAGGEMAVPTADKVAREVPRHAAASTRARRRRQPASAEKVV